MVAELHPETEARTTRAWAYTTRAIATDPPGTPIPFVASSPGRKRDGRSTRLPFDLSAYEANPIVMFVHDDQVLPIGRAKMTQTPVDGGYLLLADVTFDIDDPIGLACDRKCRSGFLFAVSLGWYDVDDRGEPIQISRRPAVAHQVVELSVCNVPMDPDALMLTPRHQRSAWRDIAAAALEAGVAPGAGAVLSRVVSMLGDCPDGNCAIGDGVIGGSDAEQADTELALQVARLELEPEESGARAAIERVMLREEGAMSDVVVGGAVEPEGRHERRMTVTTTKRMNGVLSLLRGMRGGIDSLREMLDKAESDIDALLKEAGRASKRSWPADIAAQPAVGSGVPTDERRVRVDPMIDQEIEAEGGTYVGEYVKHLVTAAVPADDPDAYDARIEELARAMGMPVLKLYRQLDGEGGCFTAAQLGDLAEALDVGRDTLVALAGADGCSMAEGPDGVMLTVDELLSGAGPEEAGEQAGEQAVAADMSQRAARCGCGGKPKPAKPKPKPAGRSERAATMDDVVAAIADLGERIAAAQPATPGSGQADPLPELQPELQPAGERETRASLSAMLSDVVTQAAAAMGMTENQVIAAVADATGSGVGDVLMYTSGSGCPPPDWLEAVAELFAIDAAVLFQAAEQDGCPGRETMSLDADEAAVSDAGALLLAEIDALLQA